MTRQRKTKLVAENTEFDTAVKDASNAYGPFKQALAESPDETAQLVSWLLTKMHGTLNVSYPRIKTLVQSLSQYDSSPKLASVLDAVSTYIDSQTDYETKAAAYRGSLRESSLEAGLDKIF